MKKNKSRLIFLMIVIFTMLLSLSTVVNAAEPILGKGTEKSPYIINMDNAETNQAGQKYIEIQYEDLANFYFKIDGDKSSGTYCVEYDKENKTVRFTYYNSDNKVLYTRTRENSEYYMQAGTSPSTTSAALDTSKVPFKIETTEKCDGTIFCLKATNKSEDKRTYVLKNAPLNGDPDVPHPSYFVFTKSGTAEELFESVSKANCAGTDFESKRVRYEKVTGWITTRNVAELIIDPRPIFSNYFPAIVIRYADWKEELSGNKIVENKDKYKVDVVYHFIGQDTDEEDKAGTIEMAITYLLLGIGEVFMFAIRLFLGSSVTMDSIIFNRYNETIIDLRGRAGIFANDAVRNIINTMYSGFEWLAIIAFIVILLYLGINIILSVGTDKQSKYFKNLENWVIGVAILFIFPRFFPYITDISNGIVSYLGKGATPMYTQYNIIAILNDEAIIGENAQTVKIDELISDATKRKEEQIKTLEQEIAKKKSSNNTFKDAVVKALIDALNKLYDYNSDMEEDIYTYVDENINNWSYINEEEFKEKIEEHRKSNSTCSSTKYLEQKISGLFTYKNNSLNIKQLEEEILMLENYNSSGQDLMSSMRAKAGKTGRVVYAIIWLILLFQMITLLAMYYKRIIMVAILLMIFPVVMITYAIDKTSDGKAQTLETWTKEFTVNIIVQIAHAIVYVFLIQTGLEIYEANPDNWLFLVLAVMVLFPVERMFRTLFGINGSTIGNLKGNIAGGVAAAALAYKAAKGTVKLAGKGAKGAYNLGKDVKNDGVSKTVKNKANNIKKAWNNYGSSEAKAKKTQDRKRQAAANRKKNARDMNIQRRREQMEKAGLAKKAMLKTMNAASMVRNGMYRVGNAERKLSRGMHKLQNSFVGKSFKLASASVRKVAGVGMGISSGVTNAVINSGKNGMAAAAVQGAKIGQTVNSMVGGSRPKPKAPSKTVPTVGRTPYHFRKNMPAGQKYKRAKTPAYQKVKNKTTRSKTTNTRIKGVKKTIKDEEN